MQKTILITGTAGFIGFHLAQRMLNAGWRVVGYDIINDYYDTKYKYARLDILKTHKNSIFIQGDLADYPTLHGVFAQYKPNVVVNLAAQAGVRYSLTHPHAYTKSNIDGFLNILEACRAHPVEHLLYASSSSVYGGNTKLPFAVSDRVDTPISLYAATKRSNELMGHVYSHLFKIPTTGLRFFTVYGPFGRPDMSMFLFSQAILAGEPINVFNNGEMQRDFTFVDDITQGIEHLIAHPPHAQCPQPFYRLMNIGNNNPTPLMEMIRVLEETLGKKATINFMPLQPGDVPATYADIDDLHALTGFQPKTTIQEGIGKFVEWYKYFHKI